MRAGVGADTHFGGSRSDVLSWGWGVGGWGIGSVVGIVLSSFDDVLDDSCGVDGMSMLLGGPLIYDCQ